MAKPRASTLTPEERRLRRPTLQPKTVVANVACGDATHRILMRRGRLYAEQHTAEDLKREATLETFGGKACGCARFMQAWKTAFSSGAYAWHLAPNGESPGLAFTMTSTLTEAGRKIQASARNGDREMGFFVRRAFAATRPSFYPSLIGVDYAALEMRATEILAPKLKIPERSPPKTLTHSEQQFLSSVLAKHGLPPLSTGVRCLVATDHRDLAGLYSAACLETTDPWHLPGLRTWNSLVYDRDLITRPQRGTTLLLGRRWRQLAARNLVYLGDHFLLDFLPRKHWAHFRSRAQHPSPFYSAWLRLAGPRATDALYARGGSLALSLSRQTLLKTMPKHKSARDVLLDDLPGCIHRAVEVVEFFEDRGELGRVLGFESETAGKQRLSLAEFFRTLKTGVEPPSKKTYRDLE